MKYNPDIHHRRSIRLKGYDYSRAGLYFITLCTQNRRHLFGTIVQGVMKRNLFGEIAREEWLKTLQIRENTTLGEFIIMPNHFHAILEINYQVEKESAEAAPVGAFRSPSHTVGAIIRGYKGATTKRIKEYIYSGSQLDKNPPQYSSYGRIAIRPKRKANINSLQSESQSPFAPDISDTGESPFASDTSATGESLFAPDTSATGEWQFAPTGLIDLSKSIWQRNYYEHIIRNEQAYRRISQYIINNPSKWKGDTFYKS